jgi:hypothetical protein
LAAVLKEFAGTYQCYVPRTVHLAFKPVYFYRLLLAYVSVAHIQQREEHNQYYQPHVAAHPFALQYITAKDAVQRYTPFRGVALAGKLTQAFQGLVFAGLLFLFFVNWQFFHSFLQE